MRRVVCLGVLLALWGTCLHGQGQNVITQEQIRADWLEQVRLRFQTPPSVTPETDAAGGCDGLKDGTFGFHTLHEDRPWWQVDLGQVTALGYVQIYSREQFASRSAQIQVLLSSDSQHFDLVYQHDGTAFKGHSDGKPLVVHLDGRRARFVRLQLPGKSYFHLDEVEAYAAGRKQNIALHRPATQSSISEWSKAGPSQHGIAWPQVLDQTLQRAEALAAALMPMGLDVRAALDSLSRIKAQTEAFDKQTSEATWQQVYFRTRVIIRRMALANPLLDFDTILFVKRAPTQFPHLSDQFYGWWSRPGGGVYLLKDFGSTRASVKCLTEDFAAGNFLRPDLHFDAERLVVAYARYDQAVGDVKNKLQKARLPEDAFYQIYEIALDGSSARRLTHGRYDDFDARYLPNGDILFLSTRKGSFVQTSQANTLSTLRADLPDSYVRCGGDQFRPVPVYTLHAIDRQGGNLRALSAFETFEYTPSVAADGRILYCRWDYIDRFNGHFFSLWSSNQDGTTPQLVYGNYTKRPQATMEPRSIPGSNKILFTAAAHHSITGGSLVLLDTTKGNEGEGPITRLTPEVPFPETEKNVGAYYANPWPLSEDFYLVSWSNRALPPHYRCRDEKNPVNAQGIYLLDCFGNLELLYRDPDISSMTPIPVRRRPRPFAQGSMAQADDRQVGEFLVQDIYKGLETVTPGSIKRLRIVGVPPKVQPNMNRPKLGVSSEETGKYVVGTVPVEADGSAYFRLLSGVPVFFQALDAQGRAVQTMRSLTQVLPGQTLACIGCHEQRQKAPHVKHLPLAVKRGPSPIQPGPNGSWPLRFDTLVQPVLDQHCVRCHQSGDKGTPFVLTADRAWDKLINYADKDLHKLVFERDASEPGVGPALKSKLLSHLSQHKEHQKIRLSKDDLERIYTWMDTYGHIQGSFSPEQDQQLIALRDQYQFLFAPSDLQ